MRNQSIYKKYSEEERENLFSQFLINSWSYSKLSTFARNEKAFEMNYLFGVFSKSSSTTIAGQAYHHALEYFFNRYKDGEVMDLVELEKSAFDYLSDIPANNWKLQKTTPTIEDCINKATKTVADLLRNFIGELSTYTDVIKEVLHVELRCDEWLTVNGVDIPLPCHAKIDLVVKTFEDKIAIVDHKSKSAYTDDEEIALAIGTQAITYALSYEEKTGQQVDEVWFIENKYSKNKDGKSQLNSFRLPLDENTRRLYELKLYEPLKRMIEAVNNPDYIYLMNEMDNLVDKSELNDFWARTQISEVEDFNVEESKKELISKRLKKIKDSSIEMISPAVIKNFREKAASFIQYDLSSKNMTQSEKIEHVLRSFGTIVKVAHIFQGYSSASYLLEVSAGTKISSIYNKRLDIANALDVANVRILPDLKVYEGKAYLCIEVSKKMEGILHFDPSAREGRKIPIGKDNFGKTIFWDTNNPSTPHILVCGATGSGKSEFLKSTLEYSENVFDEIYILDTKHTPEFQAMANNMTCFVYNEIEDIEEVMAGLVKEMNQLVTEKRKKNILIVFDEFADALASARSGKELDIIEEVQVGNYAPKKGMFGFMEPGAPKMAMKKTGEHKSLEENLRILLQKGRSTGFRIIAATQRASVKVITGDAKVNFPVQVCFNVPKAVDSKVVLDEEGAELLGGKGDGLMKSPEYGETIRFQGFFKSSEKLQEA